MKKRCRSSLIAVVVCALLLGFPARTDAGFGFSIDLFSVGPFSIGVGVSLPGIIAVGGAVLGFLFGDGSGSYSARYAGGTPVRQTISVEPDEHLSGRPLRIRLSQFDWFEDDRIPLLDGSFLKVQDDGKMVFQGSSFEGYAYWLYDGSLAVFNAQDEPALILKPNWVASKADDPKTLVLVEKSSQSRQIFHIFFGTEASW